MTDLSRISDVMNKVAAEMGEMSEQLANIDNLDPDMAWASLITLVQRQNNMLRMLVNALYKTVGDRYLQEIDAAMSDLERAPKGKRGEK